MMISFGYVVGTLGVNFVSNFQYSNSKIMASTCVFINLYFPRDFLVYLQHIQIEDLNLIKGPFKDGLIATAQLSSPPLHPEKNSFLAI